jgi:hypothetical protein
MNIKEIIELPLVVFKNKWVLKSVIFSTFLLAFSLISMNVFYDLFNAFYIENKIFFEVAKNTIYSYLQIAALGYLISKYKFCYWSVLSFYVIVYLKLIWIIDQYIYTLPSVFTRIETTLLILSLFIILYLLLKQKKLWDGNK